MYKSRGHSQNSQLVLPTQFCNQVFQWLACCRGTASPYLVRYSALAQILYFAHLPTRLHLLYTCTKMFHHLFPLGGHTSCDTCMTSESGWAIQVLDVKTDVCLLYTSLRHQRLLGFALSTLSCNCSFSYSTACQQYKRLSCTIPSLLSTSCIALGDIELTTLLSYYQDSQL